MVWAKSSTAFDGRGRIIRTDVPQHPTIFQPEWSYLKDFREGEERYRSNQKRNYDECHRTRNLPDLPDNSPVWVDMPPMHGQIPGNVVTAAPEPRS